MGETTRLTPCVFWKNIRLTPLFLENCNLAYPFDFLKKQKLQGLPLVIFLIFGENCKAYPLWFILGKLQPGLPLVIFLIFWENCKAYPLWFFWFWGKLQGCDFCDFFIFNLNFLFLLGGTTRLTCPLWFYFMGENYKAYPLCFLWFWGKTTMLTIYVFGENYKAYPLWILWFYFMGGKLQDLPLVIFCGQKNYKAYPLVMLFYGGKLQGLPLVMFLMNKITRLRPTLVFFWEN